MSDAISKQVIRRYLEHSVSARQALLVLKQQGGAYAEHGSLWSDIYRSLVLRVMGAGLVFQWKRDSLLGKCNRNVLQAKKLLGKQAHLRPTLLLFWCLF